MVKLKKYTTSADPTKQCERLALIGKAHKDIINELYSPIDATNRFINLALQNIEEDSQSRQFLLESKEGLRRTSVLLRKLDEFARRMEEEICKISASHEREEHINPQQG